MDLTLKKLEMSEAEVERLMAPSNEPCGVPGCTATLRVGEVEATGICSGCFWRAMQSDET